MQALLIDGRRLDEIGAGDRRTYIGVVRPAQRPEQRFAVEEDRHADGHVGVVGAAGVGAVVEKGIALDDIVEEPLDWLGGELERRDVDGQRFLDAEQAVVIGEQTAGEVPRVLDDGRARGLHDGVRHLADDR